MNVKLIFEYDLERKADWRFVHLDRTLSQIELRCIAKLYEGLTQVVPFAGTAICRKTCSSWLRHSIQKTTMITSMHAVNPIDMRYLSQQAKGAKGAIVCDTVIPRLCSTGDQDFVHNCRSLLQICTPISAQLQEFMPQKFTDLQFTAVVSTFFKPTCSQYSQYLHKSRCN